MFSIVTFPYKLPDKYNHGKAVCIVWNIPVMHFELRFIASQADDSVILKLIPVQPAHYRFLLIRSPSTPEGHKVNWLGEPHVYTSTGD